MKHKAYKGIVSINPYTNTSYLGRGGELVALKSLKYASSEYYVSFLNTKELISTSLAISKNIQEEDLKDAIEIKTYDELGLDQTVEYKIEYIEAPTPVGDKNRKFYVFVANPSVIEEDFAGVIAKTRFLDKIYPAPILLRALYEKNIIEEEGVHCFIYFQKNDAFLAVYKNKQYTYSKSLKYSFANTYERFCELLGERIDEDGFMELLMQEGLRSSNIKYQQYLMKLFGELFLHISDVLVYTKRAYEIDRFDKIYIGSELGKIIGIDEYSQAYLGLASDDFNFNYGFVTHSPYIDQLHYLMQLSALIDIEKEEEELCNFTIFNRPLPLLERPSGKILATTALSVAVALLYPVYNVAYNIKLKIETNMLENKYATLHEEVTNLQKRLEQLKQEKTDVLAKIEKEKGEFEKKYAILTQIYDKKVNYPMKGKILADLSGDLNRFGVKITKVENNESVMVLSLYSTDEKKITTLIKDIADRKFDRYKVETNEIKKQDDKEIYISNLKVTIK